MSIVYCPLPFAVSLAIPCSRLVYLAVVDYLALAGGHHRRAARDASLVLRLSQLGDEIVLNAAITETRNNIRFRGS